MRSRALTRLAFLAGLALGWLIGAWAWARWTPFSAVRLARARVEEARGASVWAHAPSPRDPSGSPALRPELESVLAGTLFDGDPRRIHIPRSSGQYLTLQLIDSRGVTLAVLAAGDELPEHVGPVATGSLWCIARARVLPGEEPGAARSSIEAIQFSAAAED